MSYVFYECNEANSKSICSGPFEPITSLTPLKKIAVLPMLQKCKRRIFKRLVMVTGYFFVFYYDYDITTVIFGGRR